jgi:hypothetical protein
MDGQKLLLLSARLKVAEGDNAGIRQLLDEDLRFWRMVLESSDTLISRMIALRAMTKTTSRACETA